MTAKIDHFGRGQDGEDVHRISIVSPRLKASILTWGAVLHDVRLAGVDYSLTLGSSVLEAYRGPMKSFGAVMGPVVNRIRDARAPIAGQMFDFEANLDGRHTKHGGGQGTQNRNWHVVESSPSHVVLQTELPDGLSGFPGNRVIRADYRITDTHLDLVLTAETDAPTLMSLANHSYWNLDGSDNISRHRLRIAADRYTVSGADLMVTGELANVENTPFDFRAERVFEPSDNNRFDMNFCLADRRRALSFACELAGQSGTRMVMETTEPGLQVFDLGSFDTDPFPGHSGHPYPRFAAIALEAQAWPDAANHPGFPPIELLPDQRYWQHTRWSFSRG